MRIRSVVLAWGLGLALVACGSNSSRNAGEGGQESGGPDTVPVSEQKKLDLTAWLGTLDSEKLEVLCDHLEMRLSQELLDKLTILESRQVHKSQRRTEGSTTIRKFLNERGGANYPLEFRIGKARFVVLGTAELRYLRQADAELRIDVRGKIEGTRGGRRLSAQSMHFEDGLWKIVR